MRNKLIVPIFLWNKGCPFRCAYCNQKVVALGKEYWERKELDRKVDEYSIYGKELEIGFYGGSFNFIGKEYSNYLLNWAYEKIREGKVSSIRLSVRPDNLSDELLSLWKEKGVRVLEIGIQSLDDRVLSLNLRGHTSYDALNAIERAKNLGFYVSAHIMLGLFGSTRDKDISTAKRLAEESIDGVRIHPTLVLKGSIYEDWFKRGIYKPMTLEEAVSELVDIIPIFLMKRIEIIRIGLHPDDVLRENIISGPFHPSLGDLVKSRLFKKVLQKLEGFGKMNLIICNPKDKGYLYGFKGENRDILKTIRGEDGRIVEDENIPRFSISTEKISIPYYIAFS